MNIYLASRFKNTTAVRDLARVLREHGHTVTSTWHDDEAIKPLLPYDSPEYPDHAKNVAFREYAEILNSDALVLLSDGCESTPGGLWVEMGYALGLRRKIFVLGPRTNVFCYTVPCYATATELIEAVNSITPFDLRMLRATLL